jgi:hypothetical protein
MIEISIKNMKLFEVIDEASSETFYGGWQEWYGVWWKRLSGCGPTTVTNIVSYISRTFGSVSGADAPLMKSEFRALMDDVWQYVTPSVRGIPSSAALIKGAVAYIAARNLELVPEELDIPKNRVLRPRLIRLLEFLAQSLKDDIPVAFLSLDKGEEPLLDSWHWVTLLALRYEEDGSSVFADVADEGKLLHVDLKKWVDTTGLGGGFVRFVRK